MTTPSPIDAARSAAAPTVRWSWRAFDELSTAELYAVLRLRQRVFVVEQRCPYLDADGRDVGARHLLGWVDAADGAPVLGAYARVFGPGVIHAEASIGRVVTDPDVRRSGLGRTLMTEAIRRCAQLAPGAPIRIGAQRYLEAFYASLGFVTDSAPYDEDGIEHVEMVRAGSGDA